jgi:anti-anti-sigma regulatory factor
MRDAGATGGNALLKDDAANVTRIKSAAAKRLVAHRQRRRLGLRCLMVRVNDRIVRHLIGTGYLSLESREAAPAVAIALEAWIYDNVP